ncbi:hypothetical protein C7W88_14535 [Novosphingobium sp. THN1]|nr:hypothetical protein C7W88_14535 [Novosphingobium sp. THN1]
MLGRLPLFRAAKMCTFGSSELAVEKAFQHEHLDQEGGFIGRKIGLLCSEILEEPPRLRDWHSGGSKALISSVICLARAIMLNAFSSASSCLRTRFWT